jgi:hypothetical protein
VCTTISGFPHLYSRDVSWFISGLNHESIAKIKHALRAGGVLKWLSDSLENLRPSVQTMVPPKSALNTPNLLNRLAV